ncbi:hypothetical protein RF11_01005 [Thelohanellus kitauei]|uniref:Uncharacterized protein n=1 Tax=Thelohanellus kitauei TaxID=669202 RepID=A0A0C2J0Z0_THEKT|nr:hypothetical protein RF11_01005 [Thelohanellus kitauei]
MQNIKEFESGRWKGIDYMIPPFEESQISAKKVEILDDSSNVVWVFDNPPQEAPKVLPPITEPPAHPRFIVTAARSVSDDVNLINGKLASEDSSKKTTLQLDENDIRSIFQVPSKEQEALDVNLTNPSPTSTLDQKTMFPILDDKLFGDLANHNPEIDKFKIDSMFKNNLMYSRGESMKEEYDNRSRSNGIENSRPTRNYLFSSDLSDPDSTRPLTTSYNHCSDVYHRSMEKMTRVSFTSLSTLSSHLSAMSDHVLELNSIISDLKCQNERLKHDNIILSSKLGRESGRYSFEFVTGEDNSLSIVFEIMPGKTRCINISKILSLSPDEIKYIQSTRK